MRLCASEFFSREAQLVCVEQRTPQCRFPMHNHEFNEIVVVMSGNGWHVLNDEPRLITCGEIFYIQADDRHAFEEVNDLYLTNVLYKPEMLGRALGQGSTLGLDGETGGQRRNWQLTETMLQQLVPLVDRLAVESRSAEPLADLMTESLFLQLAVTLHRSRFAADGELLPNATLLGHVLTYLRCNCTEQIDFDEVARRFGYSLHAFSRMFREATATTPHNYLVRLRLGHAMRALRNSEDSITDIAFASGFNDSNYFSYTFRKLTGLAPTEYRKKTPGRLTA
jgi:AraC-like DNA-binding protein